MAGGIAAAVAERKIGLRGPFVAGAGQNSGGGNEGSGLGLLPAAPLGRARGRGSACRDQPRSNQALWGRRRRCGVLRLVTASGLHSIQVDAAAGLATAIHMGIPIFMDGEFSPAEPERDGHTHAVHGLRPDLGLKIDIPNERESENEPGDATPITQAFQELIDGLKMPDGGGTSYGLPAPGEEP